MLLISSGMRIMYRKHKAFRSDGNSPSDGHFTHKILLCFCIFTLYNVFFDFAIVFLFDFRFDYCKLHGAFSGRCGHRPLPVLVCICENRAPQGNGLLLPKRTARDGVSGRCGHRPLPVFVYVCENRTP